MEQPHSLTTLRKLTFWVAIVMLVVFLGMTVVSRYVRLPVGNHLAEADGRLWFVQSTRLLSDSSGGPDRFESDETAFYRRDDRGRWTQTMTLGGRAMGACEYRGQLVVAQPTRLVRIEGDNTRLSSFTQFRIEGLAADSDNLYVAGFTDNDSMALVRLDGEGESTSLPELLLKDIPGQIGRYSGVQLAALEGEVTALWFQQRDGDDAEDVPALSLYAARYRDDGGWTVPVPVVEREDTGFAYAATRSPEGGMSLVWSAMSEDAVRLVALRGEEWAEQWRGRIDVSYADSIRMTMKDLALTSVDDELRMAVIDDNVQIYGTDGSGWQLRETVIESKPWRGMFRLVSLAAFLGAGVWVILGVIILWMKWSMIRQRRRRVRAPHGDETSPTDGGGQSRNTPTGRDES